MSTGKWVLRHHYGVAAFVYVVLTVVLSYPLAFHMNDHVVGRGTADIWQFPWNNFIFRENLLAGKDPYFTDRIYYPVGTSLLLHTNTEFNSVLGLVLSPFLNEIGQMNMGLMVSTFLSALGTYLLTYRLTGNFAGSLFAGIAFAFCPFRMTRFFGHINFSVTQILPFAIWSFIQMAETRKLRYAMLTGLFFAIAYYSNQYYMMFLIISFAFMTAYGFWRIPSWRTKTFVKYLVFSGFIAAVLLAQIGWHFVQDKKDKVIAQHRAEGGLAAQGSAYIRDYFLPGPTMGVARAIIGRSYAGPHSKVTTGWITLALAITGLVFAIKQKDQLAVLIAFLGILFFLITLGPFFKIDGFKIPLPYWLMMKIPYMNHVRIPYRAAPMVALPFAVMAGYGLWSLVRSKIKFKIAIVTVLFAAAIVELAQIPMALYHYEVPPVYREIAKKEGGSILTLPFYNNVANAAHQMKFQWVHKKNLLNGRTARATPLISQEAFLQRIPVAQTFEAFTRLPSKNKMLEQIEQDKAAANLFRQLFDVRYIGLHDRYAQRPDVHEYVAAVFPDAKLLYDKPRARIYELPVMMLPDKIMTDEETIRFFLFSGWKKNPNPSALSPTNESKLLLPGVEDNTTLFVEARVRTRDQQTQEGGKAVFKIKDQTLFETQLTKRFSKIQMKLPGKMIREGRRLLKIEILDPNGELLEFPQDSATVKLELNDLSFQRLR